MQYGVSIGSTSYPQAALTSKTPSSTLSSNVKQSPEYMPSAAFGSVGSTLPDWERHMRTALGNPSLEFVPIDEPDAAYVSQFFVARDAHQPEDHIPNSPVAAQSSSSAPLPSLEEGKKKTQRTTNHFTRYLDGVQKPKISSIEKGHYKNRILLYLNSRSNQKYINQQYFLDKLHMYPLNPGKVSWSELNRLITEKADRSSSHFLPPREANGLPVLMYRVPVTRPTIGPLNRLIEGGEGERLEIGDHHIVSLWSPILHEKRRSTMVLYGIGKLDATDTGDVVKHLKQLAKEWGSKPLDVIHKVEEDFPKKAKV